MKKQFLILFSSLLLTACCGVDVELLDGQKTYVLNPDNAKLTIGDTICIYRINTTHGLCADVPNIKK